MQVIIMHRPICALDAAMVSEYSAILLAMAGTVMAMLLGNLDPNFSKIVGPATGALIPLMGCCFGASLNLVTAAKAGLAGYVQLL